MVQLREVDVRFPDGVDRRRVVALGDAVAAVLGDLGTVELVSLAVSGADLATFAFTAVAPPGPVPLPMPGSGPGDGTAATGTALGLPGLPDTAAPDGEDCRDALLAAAEEVGAGAVEVVADRVVGLATSPADTASGLPATDGTAG